MEPGPAFGSRILQGPPSREDSDVAFFDQGLGTENGQDMERMPASASGQDDSHTVMPGHDGASSSSALVNLQASASDHDASDAPHQSLARAAAAVQQTHSPGSSHRSMDVPPEAPSAGPQAEGATAPVGVHFDGDDMICAPDTSSDEDEGPARPVPVQPPTAARPQPVAQPGVAEAELQDLRGQVQGLKQEVRSLRAQVAGQRATNEALSTQLQLEEEQNRALRREVGGRTAQAEPSGASGNASVLRQRLSMAEQALERERLRAERLEGRIRQMGRDPGADERLAEELQRVTKERGDAVEAAQRAQQESAALRSRVEQLSGEVDALTHRNSAMSKAIAELTSTTGGGTPTGTPTAPPSAPGAELSALQAQLARAAAELEASEQVRRSLESKCAAQAQALGDAEAARASAQREAAELAAQVAGLRARADGEAASAKARASAEGGRRGEAAGVAAPSDAGASGASVEERIWALEQKANAAAFEASTLKRRLDDKATEVASIAADRDEARAEVARLQRAVAEMEAGRADREAAVVETKEVAGTSEEVGRLTRQVAALEAQLRVSAARAAEGAGPAAGAGPVDVPDALRLAAGSDLSGTATRELHALLEEVRRSRDAVAGVEVLMREVDSLRAENEALFQRAMGRDSQSLAMAGEETGGAADATARGGDGAGEAGRGQGNGDGAGVAGEAGEGRVVVDRDTWEYYEGLWDRVERVLADRDQLSREAARSGALVGFLVETIRGWGGDVEALMAEAERYVAGRGGEGTGGDAAGPGMGGDGGEPQRWRENGGANGAGSLGADAGGGGEIQPYDGERVATAVGHRGSWQAPGQDDGGEPLPAKMGASAGDGAGDALMDRLPPGVHAAAYYASVNRTVQSQSSAASSKGQPSPSDVGGPDGVSHEKQRGILGSMIHYVTGADTVKDSAMLRG